MDKPLMRSCPQCGRELSSARNAIIGHMREHHGGYGLFRCPWCAAKADGFKYRNTDASEHWYAMHVPSCSAFLAWVLSGVSCAPPGLHSKAFDGGPFSDERLNSKLKELGYEPIKSDAVEP